MSSAAASSAVSELSDTLKVRISKIMCHYLRHALDEFSDRINHYVEVGELFHQIRRQHKAVPELHFEHVSTIVREDQKGRYRLLENNNRWYIGCCQGHNAKFKDIVENIGESIDPSDLHWVIHGTHRKLLDSIRTHGLKIMNRSHMHFTRGITVETLRELTKYGHLEALRSATVGNEGQPMPVVSGGARTSAKVLIVIDCQEAMKDGITFQKADNGVILSRGNNGILAPHYFSAVIDTEKGAL
eukprot:gb/GECG01003227.1/.p1 GENE.gb/GECG01003227.1/~~gb/GECG01003227.1/.p1  ORF type:complete len:243 (+),score=24.32 gb/GECG01003227.1/:1-729(+)